MSMIKHCDKCGKVIFSLTKGISLKSDTEIRLGMLYSTKTIDLCDSCVNRFRLWLNEESKEEIDILKDEEEPVESAVHFIDLCDEETGDIDASEYFKTRKAPNRIVHCLARDNWGNNHTIKWLIDDIINNKAYELKKLRTVGQKTVDEVIALLIEYGLIKEIECDDGEHDEYGAI